MFQTVLLTSVCLITEIRGSYQPNQDFDFLDSQPDEVTFRLGKHDDYIQEMASEELILDNKNSADADLTESSGDFEGSGFIIPITKDIASCMEAGQDTVCSNNGKCEDNKCICDSIELEIDNSTILYSHSGTYCEECPYCRPQKCQQFLPCIECYSFQKDQTCSSYCQFQYRIVQELKRNTDNDEKFCDIENSNGCFFKFKYFYNNENVVMVEYEKDYFCFDGLKFVVIIFWGVVVYIFALTAAVPRICQTRTQELRKSRTSLSRGHDVLRLDYFQVPQN